MTSEGKSVLSVREFPADLLKDLKLSAIHANMTLREYVITTLQANVHTKGSNKK
jgi:hypothetical protein